MKVQLKKNKALAGFFCAAALLLCGCRQPLEDPVWYGADNGQGKLTLSNAESDKSYEANVYDYAGGIANFAEYSAETDNSKWIGTGIAPPPVSEIQLTTPRDTSRSFWQDGTYLVVITQYDANGTKEKTFYRTALAFAGGCASIDLAATEAKDSQDLDPPIESGILTLRGTNSGRVYLAEVYSYSGGGALTPAAYTQETGKDTNWIGAGEAEAGTAATAIALFGRAPAGSVFAANGRRLVVVTEVYLTASSPAITTKYRVQTSFTNGSAALNWQAMTARPVDGGGMSLADALLQMAADKAETDPSYTINLTATDEYGDSITLEHGGGSNNSPQYVTLNGSGKTLTLTSTTGFIFVVGQGVTLTLENITLKGTGANNTELARVQTGGTLILGTGALITGNTQNNNGGGVYVNGGTLIMNGGIIADNAVTGYSGGGVYVDGGTLIMNSGIISHNEAYYDGGGVNLASGTFTMYGGTISGNEAVMGGGVNAESPFTMHGGTISANEAVVIGGEVMVNTLNGEFTMKGGTISGNEATGSGGGVSVNYGMVTMENGSVSHNKAAIGGGVYLYGDDTNNGRLIMSGGTISDNEATSTSGMGGGGVLVEANSTFTMSGGSVSHNKAAGTSNGGGVYVREHPSFPLYSGKFIMDGGTISGNTAGGSGGGVYVVPNAVFTYTGGTVSGNIPNETAP
jgi:hypothetical protein